MGREDFASRRERVATSTLRRWDWPIFVCAIGVLAFATFESFVQSRQTKGHNLLIGHTFEVMATIDALNQAVLRMQADHRAYLINGGEQWARSRAAHEAEAEQKLTSLSALVSDNVVQVHRTEEAAALLKERYASMQRRTEQIREGHLAEARTAFVGEGPQSLEGLQHIIADLSGEETHLLRQRTSIASSSTERLQWSLLFGPGVALAILAIGFVVLRRQLGLAQQLGRQLTRASARERAMLDGGGYMIIAIGLDGTITHFNRAASRGLGYSPEEMIGRETPALFHDAAEIERRAAELSTQLGEPIEPGMDVFTAMPLREVSEQRQWTYVRKDGSAIPVQLAVSVIRDDDGGALGFIGMAEDISERLHSETEIRDLNTSLKAKAGQLEDTVAELESFSYSISHDLRAPLRHIHGYARMLQEDASDVLDSECKRYIAAIGSSSRRMGLLIDDLLSLSRLGRRPLEIQPIDMGALVQAAIDEIAGESGLGARVDVHALPPAEGDASLIRQIWVNLISNAVKYSSRRGSDARITITGEAEDGVNRYDVRDNGIGFDMRYVDKLFGVFQRLHVDEEFEGTGVGLAIVHRVASRHGGSVAANGSPDHGATFSFSLPIRNLAR